MLLIQELHTYYGNIPALKGISMSVNKGEIVALLGRNGAGKTTLLNTISGALKPKSGEILFENQRIDGLEPHMVARQGISHVPEGRRIIFELTVQENLEIGSYLCWSERLGRMDRVLDIFTPLKSRLKQKGGTLSGGEQQMLAIGRGLMSNPRCLLLDELSLGLAPIIIKNLFATINTINQSGVTIILVEQNASLALELAHRAYVIQNGVLVLEGVASELENANCIREAYLGLRKGEA
jgi:branched-chain amino acid transport system ATP-binding protein